MARDRNADKLKAKSAKQKKIAIGGVVLLVVLLVVQVPKTMKMLNNKPKAPVVEATSTTPVTTTPQTGVPAAPASSASAPTQLVSAVALSPDPGQLRTFERFASKDPFVVQASASSSSTPPSSTTPTTTTPVPITPPAPPPTSAVISLNGVLMSVTVSSQFPISGPIFDRVGALFELVSLTKTMAKVTIVGGSYADGAPALTLKVGKPVTLQNTADGTRYTLVLEPQGTQVPQPGTTPGTTTPAPTTTAPSTVVPSGP